MELTIKNLCVSAGPKVILENINLRLNLHESLGLIGRSGSGKTTLVKSILGINQSLTTKGEIIFAEKFLRNKVGECASISERQFSYVPQDLALWPHLNVEDTLKHAIKWAKPHHGIKSVEKFWLEEILYAFSLENMRRSFLPQLSGGEKKRLAIARALVTKPRLIIFDEALSSFDQASKQKIIARLNDFKKGLNITFIFVSHDHSECIALCDKVSFLQNKTIAWTKDMKSFRKCHSSLRQKYNLQVQR